MLSRATVVLGLVLVSSIAHAKHHSRAYHGDGRPSAWCGWQMRQWYGGGPEYNLAANWRKRGSPASGPCVGCFVIWPHHVGVITGRDSKGWIVKSGNDGGRIRERERSVAGAVFRHPG